MSITLNAKGTSVPFFTVGKNGVTIYQGLSDPSLTYTMKDGDYWLDKALNALKVWTVIGLTWQAPRLADLHFVNSSIVSASGQNLTLSVDPDKFVSIDGGIGAASLITSTNNQDLHINPATGGGQFLVLCANRWPTTDGTNGQVLTTNGSGILSFATPPVLSVTNGGTGATTSNDAFNHLVPSQVTHSGKFLTTNGTDTSWKNIVISGSATIDFGADPGVYESSVVISGLSDILSTSIIILTIMGDATSVDHDSADHRVFSTHTGLTHTTPVAGVGFTIYVTSIMPSSGKWTIKYSYI